MESKNIKKSTIFQLQALAEYMEEHPDFARGSIVYGSSKMSVEEQWRQLVRKLNAMGPPVRTIVEWKKSWADLKSRTKKKIADNKKSLNETGGGFYRVSNLTDLEQIVDRTLFLSKAAAPSGKIFGNQTIETDLNADAIERCYQELRKTPPTHSKSVAVITPSRQKNCATQPPPENETTLLCDDIVDLQPQQHQKRRSEVSPSCSAEKKIKTNSEQINLIRRQIRISEAAAATAKEQAASTKILAEATQALVVATNRLADAAEAQTKAAEKSAETSEKILKSFETFFGSAHLQTEKKN